MASMLSLNLYNNHSDTNNKPSVTEMSQWSLNNKNLKENYNSTDCI